MVVKLHKTLKRVSAARSAQLGAPPDLPTFHIVNDDVDSVKYAVDTMQDAVDTTRLHVRVAHLDKTTCRIVQERGYSLRPFPIFLYVRDVGYWVLRCYGRLQQQTETHFVLECLSCRRNSK